MDEPYTGAWYRQQFSGINHRLNQQANECSDAFQARKALEKRIADLEAGRAADAATIGQLIEKIDVLSERLDKAAAVVAGLTKKNGAAAA